MEACECLEFRTSVGVKVQRNGRVVNLRDFNTRWILVGCGGAAHPGIHSVRQISRFPRNCSQSEVGASNLTAQQHALVVAHEMRVALLERSYGE